MNVNPITNSALRVLTGNGDMFRDETEFMATGFLLGQIYNGATIIRGDVEKWTSDRSFWEPIDLKD